MFVNLVFNAHVYGNHLRGHLIVLIYQNSIEFKVDGEGKREAKNIKQPSCKEGWNIVSLNRNFTACVADGA